MKKKAMQLPFAWIFASLIGAFILFFSIYLSVKLINQGETEEDLKAGKNIGILLNPLEIGFESAQTTFISLPVETRIYGECTNTGNFGNQKIRISQLNFKEWTDTKQGVSFQNKYIFSKSYSEGKLFYVFSKPFEMPFKVADLIYLTSSKEKYCFIEPPNKIKEELESLGQKNIEVGNCSQGAIRVCFSHGNSCDVEVDYGMGVVVKGSNRLYFEGDALMYAAIFSDANIYECQLKRLMQRLEQLSFLYRSKSTIISKKACSSNLDLSPLANLARNFESSQDIKIIENAAKGIDYENELADCRLW